MYALFTFDYCMGCAKVDLGPFLAFSFLSATLREFKFARNYFSRSPQCANLTSARIILCAKIVQIFAYFFSKFSAKLGMRP